MSVVTLLRTLVVLALIVNVLAGTDFYKVLGVKKSASDSEIKKAYRKLSKRFHPDKTSEKSAEQKFLDVGHAFEVLSDSERRKIYDMYGEEGLKQQQGNGGGFHDPFDVFRNAFGFGGGGQQQQRRGQNMMAEIEVDLGAIYKGDTTTFSIARKQICEECDGSGARSTILSFPYQNLPAADLCQFLVPDQQDIVNCGECGGQGIKLVRHQLAPGIFQQVQMHCDKCGGRGKITKHICSVCKGHRVIDTISELVLHVDRGVPEGTEINFEGEADESPDYAAGDVIVKIRSKKIQGGFVRKEQNLLWKETLSVAEALLGFKKSVKGLDGHEIELLRTGVTQPGFVQVIEGEGLPVYHESGHGDLYVEYNVVFPPSLTPQMRSSLEVAFGYKLGGATTHNEL